MMRTAVRNLVVVLGDQLDHDALVLGAAEFDPAQDAVWMAEVVGESKYVPSHKTRTALFLAAMRHFRNELRERGVTVHYRDTATTMAASHDDLTIALAADLDELRPERLRMTAPGEYRLLRDFQELAVRARLPIDIRPDQHFFDLVRDFKEYARGRKALILEFYYRELRKRTGYLMEADGQPLGGKWNYDADNRASFGKTAPGIPAPRSFAPDQVTRAVLNEVAEVYADHPGELGDFDWPVTRADARLALADFIEHRLPLFGKYQDALYTGEVYLYHSRLSAALNLKLLHPREVCDAAVAAFHRGDAPLNSVEGFVRQILGWREYVRGIYWLHMPEYLEGNALEAQEPLPELYWSGETEFICLRETVQQTLRYGYAHHIQRLMVTGLFAMLVGVEPRQVHEWYLAVYVDAVEWVEVPNTLGMSQFADGGIMATKPYAATGKYIQRMSNYCEGCPRNPAHATGETACPFTTLYWDFLVRHRQKLAANPRMSLQVKNLERKSSDELREIRAAAKVLRASLRPPEKHSPSRSAKKRKSAQKS